LREGEYRVVIDSSLEDGHLTYGEYFLQGESPNEVLISCHACHPSLCNDNLSGVTLSTFLAKHVGKRGTRLSYRFLFIPGTIGSITWLSLHESHIDRIKHGLVVACVGDPGRFTYKRSRRGNATIDRAVINVLRHSGLEDEVEDFSPFGYDERQYCSPGIDLPVGCLSRTPHGRFPEYHTSADNLEFVRPRALGESLAQYVRVVRNGTFVNTNPKCEPQLGRRGLYGSVGGVERRALELAMLWVLNSSDGAHSLLDISDRSELEFDVIRGAADLLVEHGLLRECPP
jgi:aminopeptidase-like protein